MSFEDLDTEIQSLIVEMATEGHAPLSSLSVNGARAQMEEFLSSDTPISHIERVSEYLIQSAGRDLSIRVYTPSEKGSLPVLLWFHGGGWTVGSINSYDPLCRVLANELGRIVVSVDYRLAPEHPFPAALNDCYTVLEWVETNARTVDADTNQLAVGGDSAGGNLAAAIALRARDQDGPSIEHQVLVYPVTTYPFEPAEDAERGYFLERQDVEWFWSLYLRDKVDGKNPYAAPVHARDLSGLPPTTLLTCRFDPLCREGIAYAERLREDDVPVTHLHFDDTPHGFLPLLAEPRIERAWDAIRQIREALGEK